MIPKGVNSISLGIWIALPLRDMDGILARYDMISKDMENMTF